MSLLDVIRDKIHGERDAIENFARITAAISAPVWGILMFAGFLYEEALQTVGMGIWVSIQNEEWETAARGLDTYEQILSDSEDLHRDILSHIAIADEVFRNYNRAARAQAEMYRKIITRRSRGGGGMPRGIFDLRR